MKTVLIVSTDQAARVRIAPGLSEYGWSVLEADDADRALALAKEHRPELILCDWQSPWQEVVRSCRSLRDPNNAKAAEPSSMLVVAGNGQISEKVAALESGADAYVSKPIEGQSLAKLMARLASGTNGDTNLSRNGGSGDDSATQLKFWGVRGSIAAPGPETVYYGGNTSCVEVRTGSDIIVLDAGTGIRKLGLALVKEFKGRPINLNLLITHTHWDHIQGFPFFPPAYNLNNKVTIYGYEGARQGLQSTLSSQMESPYFPISMQQMPGAITIRELKEMSFRVGRVGVKAHFLNHPGVCIGYRLFTPGGSISYLPDVELFQQLRTRWKSGGGLQTDKDFNAVPEEDRNALEFVRDSDVLILDSQYEAGEYEHRIGWGHSCFEDAVTFAVQGGVKRLFLFHHDPDHTDEQISRMVARAREIVTLRGSAMSVEAAREGAELLLPATCAVNE